MLLFKTNTKTKDICVKLSMSQQSFSQDLKRGTFSEQEMSYIAKAVGVDYIQAIKLKNGENIQ